MKEISTFFDKFRNVALRELHKREVIASTIEKITKQKIEIESIGIKNGIITLKGNHVFKSEIFLKKKNIIDSILKETGLKVVDIK